jgi:hypothetical protein
LLESAAEPTMSQNMSVTCRRSAEGILCSGNAVATPVDTLAHEVVDPRRLFYLGHHRLFRYLRAQLRMSMPPGNNWTWNADEICRDLTQSVFSPAAIRDRSNKRNG